MNNLKIKLIVAAVGGVVALVMLLIAFDLKAIKGNEIGVKESWWSGVSNTPLTPKTYFLFPWERVQVYNVGTQVFCLSEKRREDVDGPAFLVQSSDSQDMYMSLVVQWRLDPAHVVTIHQMNGPLNIEEKLLRPIILRAVKDEATVKKAIDVYSGTGLVSLQQDIEKKLNVTDGELKQRGIIVDNFVMEHIRLDENYVKEITARQIAQMKELRAVQEEKAAQAEALKAKAMARADYEKAVVEAERDAKVKVLAAEAANEQQILAAKAEAQKTILAANAEKEAGEARGAAILALGKANAESEKLKFTAYSAPGADIFAKIQVAESMSKAFGGIRGYLPESMNIYTLGNNFQQAVENVLGGKAVPKKE